jgi:hypothetical protein
MGVIFEIDVTDEIEPLLGRMSTHNKRALASAAKSLGYFMQDEIKKGIDSGSPGGATFTERIPYEIRKALQDGSAAKKWYGKMKNAIGYQYKDGTLSIGWTSRTSAMYGRKQEFGYRTPVTDAIRARYARAKVTLSPNTKYLDLPKRNVFDPMSEELQPKIAPYVQGKLNHYQTENVEFSKKSRRKYKVYG